MGFCRHLLRHSLGGAVNMRGQSPIDVHIGTRVQLARATAGIEREELANGIATTPEQMMAYELGDVRISAAALFTIAAILKQPISYFYEGLGSD